MAPGRKAVRKTFRHGHRAERKASADTFRERAGVRHDVKPFLRQEASGSSIASLNFVEEEQRAPLVANAPRTFHELVRSDDDPAFGLNRFKRDR
jgi:hypothetical protein